MKLSIFAFLALITISGVAFAQNNTVVEQTTTWQSVPVKVDTGAGSYTVVGTVPTTTTEYYYSYPGYRCFAERRDVAGVSPVTYKSSTTGGTDIYCYPAQ